MISHRRPQQTCRGPDDLTLGANVVGLDVSLLNLAVFDDEGVTLAAVVAKDGFAVKIDLERLGKLAGGVAEESDLLRCQPPHGAFDQYASTAGQRTPVWPAGSNWSPQAFILLNR